jgi:trehalose 6-phosphate phosphatase
MKYAFSPAGLKLLRTLEPRGLLVAFDFDGTLAPTVANPGLARIRPGTRALLERLAALAPTAAVTGRPLKDIRALVPSTFLAWAGNHGAEMLPRRPGASRERGIARRKVKAWSRELRRALAGLEGVWVEEKELSLSVHFRASRRRAFARRQVLRAVAGLEPGPRVLAGKCVVNLLVPELPNKGNAVQAILSALNLSHALYVGDDANDEDVFSLADPRIASVRVGRHPASNARFYLKRQAEIDRLLSLLIARLESAGDGEELRGGAKARYLGRR